MTSTVYMHVPTLPRVHVYIYMYACLYACMYTLHILYVHVYVGMHTYPNCVQNILKKALNGSSISHKALVWIHWQTFQLIVHRL